MRVYQYIHDLQNDKSLSKHEKIVAGIENAINDGVLKKGDMLPSVNHALQNLKVARQTMVNALNELKARGIIEAKNRLGYYIASNSVATTQKVMLVLSAFNSYQEELYNSILNSISSDKIVVDIYFHHGNEQLFAALIADNIGKYSKYVITPFAGKTVKQTIDLIDSSKLLLVARDEYINDYPAYVTQNFEKGFYQALTSRKDKINSYKKHVLLFSANKAHPGALKKVFVKYCKTHDLNYDVKQQLLANELEKDTLYIVIEDADMLQLLDFSAAKKWEMGQEFGLISYNESKLKRYIKTGVSTISTDFNAMGAKIAKWIVDGQEIKEIIETSLIVRNSM